MRSVIVVALVGMLVGAAPPAQASPPPNDDFAAARVVQAIPFTDGIDVREAGMEEGEPSASCASSGFPSTTVTVWYLVTVPSGATVLIDTSYSDISTFVAAYRGTGFGDLVEVGCRRDGAFTHTHGRLTLVPDAGTTYAIQVGGSLDPYRVLLHAESVLDVRIEYAGAIRGTVTDGNGPVVGHCVGMYHRRAGSTIDFPIAYSRTTSFGTYEFPDLMPSAYKVTYFDCRDRRYLAEYFNDRSALDAADSIVVPAGGVAVADAVVELAPDLVVTDLRVENTTLRTDLIDTGTTTGLTRIVHVRVENRGTRVASAPIAIYRRTSTVFVRETCIGSADVTLPPGATVERSFTWDAAGTVGDVDLIARIQPRVDGDWSNNERTAHHYVIIGGAGVGIDSFLGAAGCYPA